MALTQFFIYALTLIFVVFKIQGTIDWSWWVVFLPVLIPLGIAAVLIVYIKYID